MNDSQPREEALRRLQVWGWQGAPLRKYALLVAGFYSRCYPFDRAGAECGPALDRYGRRLIGWVLLSAERLLEDRERTAALACADGTSRWAVREALHNSPMSRLDLTEPISHLRRALIHPERAAAELLQSPGSGSAGEYEVLLRVMECLWPARWDSAEEWTPPAEAVDWARRIFEDDHFTELPVLADLLEDAGCPSRPLLDHCRSHPEHFRGCAALDRLLER